MEPTFGKVSRTIESPSHELFDDKEDKNSSDIILDRHCWSSAADSHKQGDKRTNVVPMLDVEKAPKSVAD